MRHTHTLALFTLIRNENNKQANSRVNVYYIYFYPVYKCLNVQSNPVKTRSNVCLRVIFEESVWRRTNGTSKSNIFSII